jgi:hypothetical protein
MAAPNPSLSPPLSRVLGSLAERERALWTAVAVTFVLDVTLTAYGLGMGLSEANPVARVVMHAVGPLPAMVALKGVVVAFAVVASRLVPETKRGLIPLAVATPWTVASLSNLALVASL